MKRLNLDLELSDLYKDIQNMEPIYERFNDNFFWTWANWQSLFTIQKMGKETLDSTFYALRVKNYKKYKLGEQRVSDLYELNKMKLKSGDFCFYCYNEIPKEELTADHIFPRSKGGSNDLNNIIFVCKHCNSSKGKKELLKWFMLDKNELPSPYVLGHYYRQIYQYAMENGLMTKSFAEVESMKLPFDPRSILLTHTHRGKLWYLYYWT